MDTSDQFGRPFPTYKHHRPALTTDALVIKDGKILLVTRGHKPQVGRLAFPGGHLDYNEEPPACVLRELREETGLVGTIECLVGVYGHPLRDSRGHAVTMVYKIVVAHDAVPVAADDAADAQFYDIEELMTKGIKLNKN